MTRATTALLCAVVLVALGLAVLGSADTRPAPESLQVDIAFDAFEPGVTQTRISAVDVPVASEIIDARVETIGTGIDIDVDLTICRATACRPLEAGLAVDAGAYTVNVAATVDQDMTPGASAALVGEISIVETRQATMVDTSLLMTAGVAGLLMIGVGAIAVNRRPSRTRFRPEAVS